MKKKIALLLAVSILATATFASAGNKAGAFSVSPVVGGLSFEGNQHLESSPVFGLRTGYNFTRMLGIEALFDYSRTKSTISSKTLDFYRYGCDALFHLWPDNTFVPYLAAGYAGMNLKGNNPYPETSKTKGVFDYGLGFKYFVTEDIAWRADVRGLMYYYGKEDQHAIEYTTGVYIPFGGAPAVSRLADPPPPPTPVAKPVMAPLPPSPPLASLRASPVSVTKGQTSKLSWTSRNATDCDILPVVGSVQTQGTTDVAPDHDTTYTLTCRGDGGAAKSTASVTLTVPPPPPLPPPVVLAPVVPSAAERFCNKPAILMINFDVDKYNIKPQYYNELKTVGDFLKEFPRSYGEISGHTDNTHTKAYNQKLSERRANSVKEYIIKNFGIATKRLTSKGYGLEKPIATNKTKAGRAKNRRIEANFVCENEDAAQLSELTPEPAADSKPVALPLPAPAPAPAASAPTKKAAATDVPPLASALRKQTPVPVPAPPPPAPMREAAAPDAPPLASALRKQAPVPVPAPPAPAPIKEAAAPDVQPLAPALRKQEPVPVPAAPAPAPMKVAAAPDAQPLASALRKQEPVPAAAPAHPVAVPLNEVAATNVPPLDVALRQQEPDPAAVDEAPFILRAENPGTAPAGTIMLTGISIDKNGMSITTNKKINKFDMITLVEPYSLEIDIYGAVNGLGLSKAPVKKFDLLSVRFKNYPDHLQIILDADREEIIPYRAIKTDAGLRINIKPRSSHHIGP